MNKIIISGRLTKDVELSKTSNGTVLTRFNVAVASEIKNADGERQADFFVCIAWRETAEAIAKYFKKGSPIELFGSMNSRKYESEKGTQTIWELNVNGWSFPPMNKDEKEENNKTSKNKKASQPELEPLDIDDDDLPF